MPARTERIVKFTAEWIESVRPEKRTVYHDEVCQGLNIRIGVGKSKVFYWVGRVDGVMSREKIGPFPTWSVAAARNEARKISGQAASGINTKSTATARRDEWTLRELHEWYMETHSKPHKRTWLTDDRRYTARLSQWSNRKVSRITKAEVAALHVAIGESSGHYAGNKVLELLGHEFRLGRELGVIGCDDPTKGIIRFAKTERERFLSPQELPKFLEAVEALPRETSRDFIRLALFTGARRSNVASMRWDEVDLNSGTWTIPKDKSKSKKPMTVTLCEPVLEILRRRQKGSASDYVLPGQGKLGHIVEPKHAFRAACDAAGIKDSRIHDLRRTLGSWMAAGNVSLAIIGKSLGHQSLKSTAIYARLNYDPVRVAVAAATAAMTAKPKAKKPSKSGSKRGTK